MAKYIYIYYLYIYIYIHVCMCVCVFVNIYYIYIYPILEPDHADHADKALTPFRPCLCSMGSTWVNCASFYTQARSEKILHEKLKVFLNFDQLGNNEIKCIFFCNTSVQPPVESYFSQSPSSSRARVSLKKNGVASDYP